MLTNLSLSTTDVLAVGAEGSDEVGGGQESVLVGVHDAKGLLELLDGRVGEGVENVGFLRHGGKCWVRRSTKYLQNNSSLVKRAIYFPFPIQVLGKC